MRYRLILFFCLLGFSALADFSRDSVHIVRCIDTEELDTTWEYPSTKYRNTYDVNNQLIAQEVFTNTSGSWADSVLFNYSYDAQGRRIVSLTQIFSGGNWVNQELDSTLLLINGSLSLTSNYYWAGSWLPLNERIEWTYSVLDSLVLKQVQHANGNSWENYSKNEITWNSDGKITASVNSSWQSNAWVFTDMIYNWYDVNGNDSLSVSENWIGGNWVDANRTIYQTDVMGNDSIILSQNWTGTTWENISKSMFSWDAQGRLLSDTTAYFTTGYWIYSALITHNYGSNSRIDESFTYNALTMQFIPDSKEEYFFYPSGVVESKIVHEDWSPDGAWVFWRSYYYNPDGQIAGSSSTCIGCGYYDDSYFYNNFGYLIAFEYGATTHGGIQSGERCDYFYTGLNGSPAICNSGTTVLTADSAGSCLWNNGATTQQITVSQPGIYQCDVTYADGLVLSTAPVNVEIIPSDIVNSNSDSTIVACQGSSHILSLPYYTNCIYKWYQTKHSTGTTTLINLYGSPNEITIYPTADTTTYYCIILSPCGNDTSSKTTLVYLGPAPQISFLPASGNFCQGSTLDLSVVAAGAVSYLWSTGDTTQNISITSPDSYYNVQITFSSGCTATAWKFLTAVPGAPHPEISQNGTTLLALYNSSASIQWYRNDTLIVGATFPYYTPATSGNYTVVFTNSNGCSSTSDVYHFDPNAFIAEAGTSHHICPGDSMLLGMSSNTAHGGTPGYQYLWSPSQGLSNTAIATPYAHPTQTTIYTLTVTDTLGQTATDVITVTIDSLPDVTVTSSTGVLDYCIPNSALFSAQYNNAYIYRWYNNNQVISQSYSVGIYTPGIYHLVVTNAVTACSNRSPDIYVVGLTGLSGVSTYTTGSTVQCGGTGIQLHAVADSAVSFQWYNTYNGIMAGETDSILSNINSTLPNNFYVIARAGNGCPTQSALTFIQSDTNLIVPPVTASANTFCNSSVIELNVDSTSGYSYQWYHDGAAISGADSNHVSTSISGQFTVQCTNAAGCHGSASHYVYDFHDPDTLEIVQSGAELEAIGNTSYYQWYLNGNPISNSNAPTFHPTQPGVYTVGTSFSVLNEICSSVSLPFVMNCVATWQTVNLDCNHQCVGEINLTTGGSSNYSLQWSNGSTDSVLTNLCLGSYIFHLTDSNGCDITDTIDIGDTNPITLYTDQTNVSCKDYCDGYLTLMAEGGWGIYQYYMNGVSCSNYIQNLCPGTYSILVVDLSGCKDSVTVDFTNRPGITITGQSVTPATCESVCTGSAVINAISQTGISQANWSDGQSGLSRTGICPGDYVVSIYDNYGCRVSDSITIPALTTLNVATSLQSPNCSSSCDGLITASGSGGVAPYHYLWNTGETNDSITVCAGSYILQTTDSSGCLAIDTFLVTDPDTLIATYSVTGTTCIGCTNGSITINATGGVPPYQYSIQPSAGQISGNSILNLAAGYYIACATDQHNCIFCEYLNVPDDPTNIVPINNDAEFRISPNPFRSSTILSSVNATTKIFNVEITDLSGKAVRIFENQTLPLSIDRIDLSPGTYLLKLTLENKIRWVSRMVVVE